MTLTVIRFVNPNISPALSSQLGSFLVGLIASTIAINWVSIMAFGVVKMVRKKLDQKKLKKLKHIKQRVEEVD